MAQQRPPKASKDLQNALQDEALKKAIDSAKKRAVSQHADYDTFKNMVAAAHLKPIQAPKPGTAGASCPAWQFAEDGSLQQASLPSTVHLEAASMPAQLDEPPKTHADFHRHWRRISNTADQLKYLQRCSEVGFKQLFKVEITGEALGSIIKVLDWGWQQASGQHASEAGGKDAFQHLLWTTDVLADLPGAGRFPLSVRLLGPAAKQAARELLHDLEGTALRLNNGAPATHACDIQDQGPAPDTCSLSGAGSAGSQSGQEDVPSGGSAAGGERAASSAASQAAEQLGMEQADLPSMPGNAGTGALSRQHPARSVDVGLLAHRLHELKQVYRVA